MFNHSYPECYKLLGSLTFNVSVPSPRSVGAVAEYTCEVGYQLTNGNTQRTCLDSLSWDETWPTCTKVTCFLTFHTVCYNCDIVDGSCPFDYTTTTFDECRAAAISNNSMFVDYNTTICKTFSCQIPTIIYTAGSVALFSSCSQGISVLPNLLTNLKAMCVNSVNVNKHICHLMLITF